MQERQSLKMCGCEDMERYEEIEVSMYRTEIQ